VLAGGQNDFVGAFFRQEIEAVEGIGAAVERLADEAVGEMGVFGIDQAAVFVEPEHQRHAVEIDQGGRAGGSRSRSLEGGGGEAGLSPPVNLS
jgi:hypothetical protein